MIDNYYKTYCQMRAKKTGKPEKPPKSSGFAFWKDLADQRGKTYTVLFAALRIISLLLVILTLCPISGNSAFYAPIAVLSAMLAAVMIALVILDKKWHKSFLFLNISYYDAIDRALQLKKAFSERFRFRTAAQYEMVLAAAQERYGEMREHTEQKRQKAEQILFGGILAVLLAFVPAIISGFMENCGTDSNPFSGNVLTVTTYAGLIVFALILILGFIYLGTIREVHKLEKDLKQFSGFLADIRMLTEIEAGLHPLAGQKQDEDDAGKDEGGKEK